MDLDFHNVQTDLQSYQHNYQSTHNCLSRFVLLSHLWSQLDQARTKIKQNQNDPFKQNIHLQINDLKNIKQQDSSSSIAESFIKHLQQIKGQKQNPNSPISVNDIYSMLFLTFKPEIIQISILVVGQNLFKLLFIVVLQQLFHTVAVGDKSRGYILIAVAAFCYIFSSINRYNADYNLAILGARIKAGIILLLTIKILSLSSFMTKFKQKQISKVTNMISNDFNIIQLKLLTITGPFIFPLVFIGIGIILCTKLGWPGLISLLISLVILPLQYFASKICAQISKQANIYKDQRLKMTGEIIQGIKFIKIYCWQYVFKKFIRDIRQKEINLYVKLSIGRAIERALAISVALWAGLAIFYTIYEFQTVKLTTSLIFSTLYFLYFLRYSALISGTGLGLIFQMNIIFERLISILNIQNVRMKNIDQGVNEKRFNCIDNQKQDNNLQNGEILFRNFNGYWSIDKQQKPFLKNINIDFKKGVLYGIYGQIGSGKSTLLSSILQELSYYSGTIVKKGSIAYVQQQPILFSGSIKQNILFGKQFHSEKYFQAIKKSCLIYDLGLMDRVDETQVGQRGVSLSGGQKTRVILARAIYVDADIYLFDDPISSLDSNVSQKIFSGLIQSLSKLKTVILTTHNMSLLQKCDKKIGLENGTIRFIQTTNNLNQKFLNPNNKQDIKQVQQNQIGDKKPLIQNKTYQKLKQKVSKKSQIPKSQIQIHTYFKYFFSQKFSKLSFPLTIFIYIFSQIILIIYMRLLSYYDKNPQNQALSQSFNKDHSSFWNSLVIVLLLYYTFLIIKFTLSSLVTLSNNRQVHQNMIQSILRSKPKYFDTVKTGDLLNKFSNDLGILDTSVPFLLIFVLDGPLSSIIALVNSIQTNIYYLPIAIICIFVNIFLFLYCKQTIIETKNIDLKSRIPVFRMLGQTITGVLQLKVFNRRQGLLKQFSKKINDTTRTNICYWNVSKIFGVYLEFAISILLIISWVIGVYTTSIESTGLFAVSTILLLQANDFIQYCLRQLISLQATMVSYKRIQQVMNLQPERQLISQYDKITGIGNQSCVEQNFVDDYQQKQTKFSSNSLSLNPTLQFKNVFMKYQQNLPYCLKNLNFHINAGQKIAVIGRTGAGKSSIIETIFRICQPQSSSQYYIDKYDATKMGLHTLRSNISVITQTPFLFRGSIRNNLDPLELYSLQEIQQALQQVGLLNAIKKLPQQLNTDISFINSIFSVGQKQLLCLARVLLKKQNKFLVLDEATSNIDMKTDQFIQNVIKNKFKNKTIITIAHRLNTISDYDRIFVMDGGKIVECGKPYELILQKGMFFNMVSNMGKNGQIIVQIAKQTYYSKQTKNINV